MKFKKLCASLVLIFTAIGSSADTARINPPWQWSIHAAQNAHYRLFPVNHDVRVCSGSHATDFTYVNASDDGAKGKMAALLMAFSLQKAMDIFTVVDANGYCQLVEFYISP